MDVNKLNLLSDEILLNIKNHIIEFQNIGSFELKALDQTQKTVEYLQKEVKDNPHQINKRILRGMHDVGIYSYKVFENTNLEKSINDLTNELWTQITEYRTVKPLDLDYGKEYPI